jgi:hypothetical protein
LSSFSTVWWKYQDISIVNFCELKYALRKFDQYYFTTLSCAGSAPRTRLTYWPGVLSSLRALLPTFQPWHLDPQISYFQMASGSKKSTNVLRDSLLRIQTRLQEEEAEHQASSSGSQSATLRHRKLNHVIEGKLAIVEELLGSLNSENGQEELRQQQRRATDLAAASVQEEINDRVSSRIAVQCIFTQRNSNSDNPGFLSNNPFRNRQHIAPPSEDHGDPFLSEVEKRRRRMIQNNNKAATARNAQQKWKDEIQKQANTRREESLKLLADLRKGRDKAKLVEEEVRQRALREAAERAAEIAAEAAARAAAEEAERRAREIECAVCFETFDMGVAARLPCMHWYCWEHLEGTFPPYQNV